MRKGLSIIDWWFESISVAAFILAIGTMFVQIIFRYFFQSPFMWAEEIARLLFVWIVYLGVPVAIKRHANIAVDYFIQYLPEQFNKRLKVVLYIIAAVFSLIIAYFGLLMIIQNMHMSIRTLPISQAVWYLPIVLGFLMMAINFIRVLPDILAGRDE
ncbi:TRAP transporter small permease [Oceanobacillus sojae]|uniref:TRAP transporter small permease n=1 Tax=Oceanobacillus sojae TaxID=582851 RepID=UPI0021A882FE|nr:TRAP transporter small permease [Oceanobacillus sojae]MCT1901905.1 TRAP transporter small permease [Oceanobacillus sojae]